MADKTRFIRVPWSFAEHPKTEDLSDAAVGRLVKAWIYCARNENDGVLTDTQTRKLFPPKILAELLGAPYVYKTDSGYLMHEWAGHQMTKVEGDDLRVKRAAAGSAGGKAKAARHPVATPAVQQTPSKSVASAKQTSSESVAEVEVEEEQELIQLPKAKNTSSPAATDDDPPALIEAPPPPPKTEPDRFEEFWDAYPHKVDKQEAAKVWPVARKRAAQQTIIDGARTYRDDPNRNPAYTKGPARWLRAGAWANEPEPNRTAADVAPIRNYAAERQAAAVAVVNQLRDERTTPDPWATPARRQIGTR